MRSVLSCVVLLIAKRRKNNSKGDREAKRGGFKLFCCESAIRVISHVRKSIAMPRLPTPRTKVR